MKWQDPSRGKYIWSIITFQDLIVHHPYHRPWLWCMKQLAKCNFLSPFLLHKHDNVRLWQGHTSTQCPNAAEMRFRAAGVRHTSNGSTAVWSSLEAELALGRSGVILIQRRARWEGEEDEEAAEEVMREIKCAGLKTSAMITTVGTRPKVRAPSHSSNRIRLWRTHGEVPRRPTRLSAAQRSLTHCFTAAVQSRRSNLFTSTAGCAVFTN